MLINCGGPESLMMEMTTVASAVRATVDGRLSVARTLNCEEENYNKSFELEFLYFKAG